MSIYWRMLYSVTIALYQLLSYSLLNSLLHLCTLQLTQHVAVLRLMEAPREKVSYIYFKDNRFIYLFIYLFVYLIISIFICSSFCKFIFLYICLLLFFLSLLILFFYWQIFMISVSMTESIWLLLLPLAIILLLD